MSLFFQEYLAPLIKEHSQIVRGRVFLIERKEFSVSGDEDLLSVSEYSGVTKRRDNLEDGEFLSRANTLEGYRIVRQKDLVMNYMLAWKGALGVSNLEGITSPAYSIFKINSEYAEPRFIHALFRSDLFCAYFRTESTGIIESRLRLYPESLMSLKMVLPPVGEQREIATYLDRETARIDALVDKKIRFIELLREKCQALITHAVTKGLDSNAKMKDSRVEWLGQVPQNWCVRKLVHLTTKIGDGLHGTPDYIDSSNYFFINGNNLQNGSIYVDKSTKCVSQEEYESNQVELNDSTLLMSINGTIGNLAFYRGESIMLGKSAAYINCSSILSREMLYYLLQSKFIETIYKLEATGTTITNLSLETLRKTPIPLPPAKEQSLIVDFLNCETTRINALINKIQLSINLLKERRAALVTAAVTGQIDLREVAQ